MTIRHGRVLSFIKLGVVITLFVLMIESFIGLTTSLHRTYIPYRALLSNQAPDESFPSYSNLEKIRDRVTSNYETNVIAREKMSSLRQYTTAASNRTSNDASELNEVDITKVNLNATVDYLDHTAEENQTFDELSNDTIVRLPLPGDTDITESVKMTFEQRVAIYDQFFKPLTAHDAIDCHKVVGGNEDEIGKAQFIMREEKRVGIEASLYSRMLSCDIFKKARGYIEHPLSKMENDFPLSFGIVVYKDVEQVERLLRAIWRPHNVYCLHIDKKTTFIDRRAIQAIAACFDNVHLVKDPVDVQWGEFSVLEAELKCMEVVANFTSWKYYINLTGQEFPLKTNRELVAILRGMDGANIVDGTWIRAKQKYFYRWSVAKRPPPHNIWPIKGSIHVAVTPHFVNFCVNDQRARDLLDWLRETLIPDETFFASLNHNPHLGIKGSFLGDPEEYPLKPSFMRYKNWEMGHSTFVRNCMGKFVRHICILGVGDLQKAYSGIGLFANKFHLDFEPFALSCLEEVLHNNTWEQFLHDKEIDVSFYTHLDFVKLKLA